MPNKATILLVTGIILSMLGCGSPEGDKPGNAANTPTNKTANTQAADLNANLAYGVNGNIPAGTNVLVNANRVQVIPKEPKPMVMTAPEESEYTSELTDVAREVRTFKNHPQLLKVEKTIKSDSQTVKVYLRNGKVVTISPDKVRSIRYDAASSFLAAAGVIPPPPALGAPSEKKDKSGEGAGPKKQGQD